jgi:hypothetical protein
MVVLEFKSFRNHILALVTIMPWLWSADLNSCVSRSTTIKWPQTTVDVVQFSSAVVVGSGSAMPNFLTGRQPSCLMVMSAPPTPKRAGKKVVERVLLSLGTRYPNHRLWAARITILAVGTSAAQCMPIGGTRQVV